MKPLTVTNHLLIFIFVLANINSYAQDFEYKKEVVYFKMNDYKECKYEIRLKKVTDKGIQFNLCGKAVLLHKDQTDSDTLCISHLKKYKISTIEDIEQKKKEFRYKTYKKFPKNKNDKLYQAYDNNDLFETYVIEVLPDERKFVIYPVLWRNQGIIE